MPGGGGGNGGQSPLTSGRWDDMGMNKRKIINGDDKAIYVHVRVTIIVIVSVLTNVHVPYPSIPFTTKLFDGQESRVLCEAQIGLKR